MTPLGLLVLEFRIPDCHSLKEKRGLLRSLESHLRKKFNISIAEVDRQDSWQAAVIACSMVGSDRVVLERNLQSIPTYCEMNFRDFELMEQEIEIF
jgi:uncharacterized protein